MKVYLIARPLLVWDQWEAFERDEQLAPVPFAGAYSDAERLVEASGRLCYMSYNKGRKTNKEFIENLIQSGHHSVLEHANWSLLITGISRSCSHELVRHRHFSYSQLSQRYVDHSDMPVIAPPNAPESMRSRWGDLMTRIRHLYMDLTQEMAQGQLTTMEVKRLRTAIRSILPNAMSTKLVMTGNARAWRMFIQTRAQKAADPEIAALAVLVYHKLSAAAPTLFEDAIDQ